jgi:hypothetical protein
MRLTMIRALALLAILVTTCTATAAGADAHARPGKRRLSPSRCVATKAEPSGTRGGHGHRVERSCRQAHARGPRSGAASPTPGGKTSGSGNGGGRTPTAGNGPARPESTSVKDEPVAPSGEPGSTPTEGQIAPPPVAEEPVEELQVGPERPTPVEEEEGEPGTQEGGSEPGTEEAGTHENEGSGVLAQGEDFGDAPADVLLPAAAGVSLEGATACTGIGRGGAESGFGGVEAGPESGSVRLQLVPGGTMPRAVSCPTPLGSRAFAVTAAAPTEGGVVEDPIDPKYLSEVPFGTRSFWIQPWRSYLDTPPASRLLDAVGINFNVTAAESESTARLLQGSGFKLARIEISWNQISDEDPSRFVEEEGLRRRLVALREHGLRPLILLNSNSGGPAPATTVTLTTTEAAPAGARTVMLDPASAAAVLPERTGFANLSFGGNPDVLVTNVAPDGEATLSQPLPALLPAGEHNGSTLRFGPFGPPELADGSPNPEYQRTLAGWLEYVGAVNRLADEVLGAGNYDFEVWNELSFGSQFLDESNYYSPVRTAGQGSITAALLQATVEYLRDPANGASPEVGITDGFASQTPFAAPGSLPAGTTAMSKHLYEGPLYFPRNATINGVKPLDALGRSDATGRNAPFTPKFTPNFGSAFPEYYLTAIQTESLIRDLSPDTNTIYGVPHGRDVGPAGGSPVEVWMTEYNLDTKTLKPLPTGNQDEYIGPLTEAQEERVQAEIVLRSLVSMVNKGLGREYFYAAAHYPGYDLISESFMAAVDADPTTYPAGQSGGDTMAALPRMLSRFAGPGPSGQGRQLSLLSIAQEGDQAVWSGDGTAAHPNLYNRELLAVLPFQSAPTHFVIPFYVMTPNLTTVWNPAVPADSPTRFDLPGENFRITLGNLPETAAAPEVSAYDPLSDESTPARLVSRAGDEAVFEISATDYPRLLSVEYGS